MNKWEKLLDEQEAARRAPEHAANPDRDGVELTRRRTHCQALREEVESLAEGDVDLKLVHEARVACDNARKSGYSAESIDALEHAVQLINQPSVASEAEALPPFAAPVEPATDDPQPQSAPDAPIADRASTSDVEDADRDPTPRAPGPHPEYGVDRETGATRGAAFAAPDEMLEWAEGYAALGWPLVPIDQKTKRPLGGKGIDHATTDLKTIHGWWARWPHAGVGVHLAGANLCAIDLDPRNGCTKTPADFPATLTAKTGGGGWHLIYKAPKGVALPGKLGPGIDLKHKGYIVLAPSGHPSGNRYQWVDGFDPMLGMPDIADFPVGLLAPQTKPKASSIERGDLLDILTEDQIVDLRSALAHIPSDDRDTWVRLGHALVRYGDAGRELWEEWSQKSAKFDDADAERVWESLDGDHTDYGAVFAEAQRLGWKNPKAASTTPYADKVDRTDVGNANFIRLRMKGNLRFVHELRKWIYWDGERWTVDRDGSIARRLAHCVAEHYGAKAKELEAKAQDPSLDAKERERILDAADSLRKWEKRCRSSRALTDMLHEVSMDLGISASELDRDPDLLGVQNGVVDLRTGELRPAAREDYVTKRAAAAYNPKASAPRWLRFIDEITGSPLPVTRDEEGNVDPSTVGAFTKRPLLADYLQRVLGYSLSGRTVEHKMFAAVGDGSNGKNVLFDTGRELLPEHWIGLRAEALMESGLTVDAERPTSVAASLEGARAAIASETKDGQHLDVPLIKAHTGDTRMSARRMRENSREFRITHKLWLATNHRPAIDRLDPAIRARLHLIPFDMRWNRPGLPERDPALPDGDKDLGRSLLAEAEGILAWLVQGAVAYYRDGLDPAPEVTRLTIEYLKSQDPVGRWLDTMERCPVREGTLGAKLLEDFSLWSTLEEKPVTLTKNSLAQQLKSRGFEAHRTNHGAAYPLRKRNVQAQDDDEGALA